jgi:uncharacterized protein (TIGR02246 family)
MNRERILEFAQGYTAAWCSHDAARVAACYAQEGTLTINAGVPARGRAAVTQAVQAFMSGYPDLIVTLEGLEQAGERTLFHWGFTGTNSGPGGSHRPVRIRGYEAWRFGADGLIADSLGHYDAADWQRQVEGRPGASAKPASGRST